NLKFEQAVKVTWLLKTELVDIYKFDEPFVITDFGVDLSFEERYRLEKKLFQFRMKKRRKELKMSQEDLGLKIGIDRTNISKYETGVYEPELITACILAEGLEWKVWKLFSD